MSDEKNNKKSDIVLQNRHFAPICIGCILVFLGLGLLVLLLPEGMIYPDDYIEVRLVTFFVLQLVGSLPASCMLLFIFNWRIIIEEDRFLYRNFWRKERAYVYKECLMEYTKLGRMKLYSNGKRIRGIADSGLYINSKAWSKALDKIKLKL